MTLNVIIAKNTQPNLSLSDIQGIKIWRHHFFGFGALDSVFRPGAELVLIFFFIFYRWRYKNKTWLAYDDSSSKNRNKEERKR